MSTVLSITFLLLLVCVATLSQQLNESDTNGYICNATSNETDMPSIPWHEFEEPGASQYNITTRANCVLLSESSCKSVGHPNCTYTLGRLVTDHKHCWVTTTCRLGRHWWSLGTFCWAVYNAFRSPVKDPHYEDVTWFKYELWDRDDSKFYDSGLKKGINPYHTACWVNENLINAPDTMRRFSISVQHNCAAIRCIDPNARPKRVGATCFRNA